jgi:hypothetical protein
VLRSGATWPLQKIRRASQAVETFGYRQEPRRSLNLFDLLLYGLVYIVPIAPMAVFGYVFNASHGMVPLVYLIGSVAMVFTALSYVAMAHELLTDRTSPSR